MCVHVSVSVCVHAHVRVDLSFSHTHGHEAMSHKHRSENPTSVVSCPTCATISTHPGLGYTPPSGISEVFVIW